MIIDFEAPYATCDHHPEKAPRLRFWVTAIFPTAGWTWSIAPSAPQGTNPQELLLTLTVTHPTGVFAAVRSPQLVEYTVKHPGIEYTGVNVTVDGDHHDAFHVDVIETS
jgi:hypothetical protein